MAVPMFHFLSPQFYNTIMSTKNYVSILDRKLLKIISMKINLLQYSNPEENYFTGVINLVSSISASLVMVTSA